MNETQILTCLQGALITVVTAAVPILTRKLVAWIEAKATAATAVTQNAQVQVLIGRAEDAVKTAVDAVSQKTVAQLKAAAEDGKLTAEEAELVFDTAKSAAISTIGDVAMAELRAIYGDVEAWLGMKIEQAVKNGK